MNKILPVLLLVIAFCLGWLCREKYTERFIPAEQPGQSQPYYQEPVPQKVYPDLPSGGINDLRGET